MLSEIRIYSYVIYCSISAVHSWRTNLKASKTLDTEMGMCYEDYLAIITYWNSNTNVSFIKTNATISSRKIVISGNLPSIRGSGQVFTANAFIWNLKINNMDEFLLCYSFKHVPPNTHHDMVKRVILQLFAIVIWLTMSGNYVRTVLQKFTSLWIRFCLLSKCCRFLPSAYCTIPHCNLDCFSINRAASQYRNSKT